MKRTWKTWALAAGIPLALAAQSPQTTPGQQSTTGAASTQSSASGQTQASAGVGQNSWSGVLMDATCAAVTSGAGSGSGVTSYSGSQSGSATASTGATGTRPTGEGTTSTASAGQTSQGARDQGASSTTSTSSPTTTGTGTTAAAGTTGQSGQAGHSGAASGDTSGQRSRSSADSASFSTVREKYRDCMVKPTTTSFAIHSDGRVILLDEASNQTLRQKVAAGEFKPSGTGGTAATPGSTAGSAGSNDWMSVTVNGSMQGDRLSVSSVSR